MVVMVLVGAACTAPDAPPTGPSVPAGPPLGAAGLHTLAGAPPPATPVAGYVDGAGSDARFTTPRDVSTTADGATVWVTDTLTVRNIDARTGATTTRYTAPAGTRNLGDIDVDAAGRVFFGQLNADYTGTVYRIDLDGTTTALATIPSKLGQFPLATTPDGDVLVPSAGPRASGSGTTTNLARVDGDTGAVTLLGTYEQCGLCYVTFEITAIDVDADGTPIILTDGAINQDGWYYQPMLYSGYPSPTARAVYSVQSFGALSAGPGPALFTNNASNAVRVLPNGTARSEAFGDYPCSNAWVIAGCNSGFTDGPNGQLRGVNGVHYDDASGRIYIADGNNHAIRWAHVPAVPAAPRCADDAYRCTESGLFSGLGVGVSGSGLDSVGADVSGQNWNDYTFMKVAVLDASIDATRWIQVSEALTDTHFEDGIVWASDHAKQSTFGIPAQELRGLTWYRWRVVTRTPDGDVASKSVPIYFRDAPTPGGDLASRAIAYPFGPNVEGGDPINGAENGTAGFIARGPGAAGALERYLVTSRHVTGGPGSHVYTENIMADGNAISIGAGVVVAASGTADDVGEDVAAVKIAPWRTARAPLRCRTISGTTRSVTTHVVRGTSMTQAPDTSIGSCGHATGSAASYALEGIEAFPGSSYLFALAGIEWHGGDSGGPVWEVRPDGPYIGGVINRGAPGVTYGGYTPLNDTLNALAPELGQLVPLTGG